MPSPASPLILLFSVDGMRPDALLQADTPTLDGLMARGSVSLTARSVMPSITLPCHLSMLRGVDVPRHGITDNRFQPLARPVPGLFEVAHAGGRRTGFFYNWEPLRDLSEPGSLDVAYFHRDCYTPEGDWRIARTAAKQIIEQDLDFAFVYLGFTDECAHRNDWMSGPYLDAIANADRCIGHVLDACARTDRPTVALVQSDHGGHGRSHGTDCPEDMTIPWILNGPGVREGHRLEEPIRIYDTCPTLSALLGLNAAREWEGRVVREALL